MIKRLIIITFCFLFCMVHSIHAQVTAPVSSCVASTTSCTLSPVLTNADYGAIILVFSTDQTAATATTLAAGYTSLTTKTQSTSFARLAWKKSVGTETTCGTWTNATAVVCMVYLGADIGATGSTGVIGTPSGASGTTLTYPTPGTLTNSRSWVVGFGEGSSATNVDVAPTGSCGTPVLRSGTSVNSVAGWDTNGSVASCSAQTVTIGPTGLNIGMTVELLSPPAFSSIVPNIVQYASWSTAFQGAGNNVINNIVMPLPNPTLSNNLLVLTFTYEWVTAAPTISSLTDNATGGSNTWVANQIAGNNCFSNTGDVTNTCNYYVAGAKAGVTQITLAFSSTVVNFHWKFQELSGMATSSPVDGTTVASISTGAFVNAGSITTTQASDFIYEDCIYVSNGFGTVLATAAFHPGGVIFLGVDRFVNFGSEGFIQNAAGAIAPFMEFDGSTQDTNCIATAFKTSTGAGTTRAAGIKVVGLIGYQTNTAATQTLQVPFLFGNTIALGAQNTQSGNNFTGLTDSNSNPYTIHQTTNFPAFALSCNTTGGDNVLMNITGQNVNPGPLIIWDIVGAKVTSSTSCFDSTAGYITAQGTQSGTANIPNATNPLSITPSTSNGLVLAMSEVGTGPTQSLSTPSTGLYLCTFFTGAVDGETFCEGNAAAQIYNATKSAISWSFVMNNSPGGTTYDAATIALIAAPVGPQPMTTLGGKVIIGGKVQP